MKYIIPKGVHGAGKVICVDDEDYELLNKFDWLLFKNHKDQYYAVTTIRMHRLLLGEHNPKVLIDHKDGDTLNNQKSNLRRATPSQNRQNIKKRSDSKKRYKGVYWAKYYRGMKPGSWKCRIVYKGKRLTFGSFADEQDAAMMYDFAACRLYGEFARLNFPDVSSGDIGRYPMCVAKYYLASFDRTLQSSGVYDSFYGSKVIHKENETLKEKQLK